jgi:hypothetical protein
LSESNTSGEGQSKPLRFPPALGCLASILVGLLGAAIFFVVVSMALRGEVRFTQGELGETRFWVINEADDLGLAYSIAQVVQGDEDNGAACVETCVNFVMFRSSELRQPVTYCECFQKDNGRWFSTGDCAN